MQRNKSSMAALGILTLLAGCGGQAASASSQPDQKAATPVQVKEVVWYPDIQSLVDRSTVVVEGTIETIEFGPIVGEGDGAIGLLDVGIRVTNPFLGAKDGEVVHALITGYQPDNKKVSILAETHPAELGANGVWFLHETGLDNTGTGLYTAGSAGWIKEGAEGRAVTGGQQPVAAETCGQDMKVLTAEVERAVKARTVPKEDDSAVAQSDSERPDPANRIENECAAQAATDR